MKHLIYVLICIISIQITAQASDLNTFKYIQPISVETRMISTDNTFLDKDGDGVADTIDKCLNTQKNVKVDRLGCKLLRDNDNDGISNKDDKCPKTKANSLVDSTGCEPDDDNDNVINTRDECPNTSQEFMVDTVGCPQTAKLNIKFQNNKHTVLPQNFTQMEAFVEFLQNHSSYQAIIYGYTHNLDTTKNAKELSQKRANAFMNVLIKHGVKLTRLTAIGMGLNKSSSNSIKIDLLQ